MKTYIIFGVAIIATIFGAFWAGGRIAHEKCMAKNAIQNNIINTDLQSEIIKSRQKINEETYNTGVADIRIRLREKYTIRD